MVTTFSTVFPGYHPNKGEPTFFAEKILNWYWNTQDVYCSVHDLLIDLNRGPKWNAEELEAYAQTFNVEERNEKGHTIRAGKRYKTGDWLSPRIWSGKPYNSKQLQFCPDLQIKVYDFQIKKFAEYLELPPYQWFINGELSCGVDERKKMIYENDGLSFNEFEDWFKMDKAKKDIHFDGQIIVWDETINY